MIEIPEDEFMQSLTYGYKQFMAAYKAGNTQEVIRLKGWCNAMEGMVFTYKPELKSQLLQIRSQIVTIKTAQLAEDDWEIPTYIRKKMKIYG